MASQEVVKVYNPASKRFVNEGSKAHKKMIRNQRLVDAGIPLEEKEEETQDLKPELTLKDYILPKAPKASKTPKTVIPAKPVKPRPKKVLEPIVEEDEEEEEEEDNKYEFNSSDEDIFI